MAWFSARSFHDYLLGDRARLGDDWAVVDHLAATQPRARANWWLPLLATALAFVMLAFHWWWLEPNFGWVGMLYRIFVIDYTVFFFGLLSGYDMARRWRTNPEMIEELSLTPLPPAAVASALVAAPCAVWWRVLAGLALVEALLPVPHFVWLMDDAWHAGLGVRLGDIGQLPLVVMCIVAALVLPWVLAWFHYESIRLAHWMFVVHAIPRVSLVGAGISNFIAMTFAVVLLSGVGSAITGTLWLLSMILVAIFLEAMQAGSENMNQVIGWYSVWGLCSIAGALVVAWIKRAVARLYIDAFTRSWLLYAWWGAAERTQPTAYPATMRARLPLWEAYFGMTAEKNANVPMHKRYKTAYYKALLNAQSAQKTRVDAADLQTTRPLPTPAFDAAKDLMSDDFLAKPTPPLPPVPDHQALNDAASLNGQAPIDNAAPVASMDVEGSPAAAPSPRLPEPPPL